MSQTPTTQDDRMKKASERIDDVVDDARDRLVSAGEAARRDAKDVGRSIAGAATDLKEAAATRLRAVGVDADDIIVAAREQAVDLQHVLIQEVRARPLRAIGIAALVGLAFGLLSSR